MVNQPTQMDRTAALKYLIGTFVNLNLLEARGRIAYGEDPKYKEAAEVLTPEECQLGAQRAYEIWQNAESFGRALRLDSWKNTRRSNQIGFAYTDRQIVETLQRDLTTSVLPYRGLLHTLHQIFGLRGTVRVLTERILTQKQY